MTVAEKLKYEGKQLGMEEGRTALILKLIKKRFGKVSSVIEQKLLKSNIDILDQFGESLFDFKNLKDAEKWWEKHNIEQ